MKDRFKELRKELNVTQQEFADKLKISRNFVAQIEMGSKVPSDRTIDDVCREFNVNEEWLRTGNGDMFIPGIKDKQISAMLADVIDHIEYKAGIRTDGLTMSIYSSIMVAATPVCNSIFSAILNASGYDQAADIALGTAAQTAAAQTAISVGYIWVETIAYVICAILIFFFTIEKNLPEEQKAIAARKNK